MPVSDLFERAFSNAPIGMALVDMTGRVIHVNGMLCHITGYTPEELRARPFSALTDPGDADAEARQIADLIAGRIPAYHLERQCRHANGHRVSVQVSVSLVIEVETWSPTTDDAGTTTSTNCGFAGGGTSGTGSGSGGDAPPVGSPMLDGVAGGATGVSRDADGRSRAGAGSGALGIDERGDSLVFADGRTGALALSFLAVGVDVRFSAAVRVGVLAELLATASTAGVGVITASVSATAASLFPVRDGSLVTTGEAAFGSFCRSARYAPPAEAATQAAATRPSAMGFEIMVQKLLDRPLSQQEAYPLNSTNRPEF